MVSLKLIELLQYYRIERFKGDPQFGPHHAERRKFLEQPMSVFVRQEVCAHFALLFKEVIELTCACSSFQISNTQSSNRDFRILLNRPESDIV